jgi:uncharacterized coiled-coil protein SlyX
MPSDTDRITELEVRAAHQQRELEQLHEVLLDLRHELETSRRKVSEIEEKLRSDAPEVGPANERPPHW